jgi:hypothetical protein
MATQRPRPVVLVESAVLVAAVHDRPLHGKQRAAIQLQAKPASRQRRCGAERARASKTYRLELGVHVGVVRCEEYAHLHGRPTRAPRYGAAGDGEGTLLSGAASNVPKCVLIQ